MTTATIRPLTSDDPSLAEARLAEALRHCEQYRLVDRVRDQAPDALTAEWAVPEDIGICRGDGQGGMQLLPGTVTCEHAVQCGEALIFSLRGRQDGDGVALLARIRAAKFRGMVRPGDLLVTEVALVDQVGPAYVVRARTRVEGGALAYTGELVFTASQAAEAELRAG